MISLVYKHLCPEHKLYKSGGLKTKKAVISFLLSIILLHPEADLFLT